jgi:hypothetical protein
VAVGQEHGREELPSGAPGTGSIFTLAFIVILLPGVVAYGLLRVVGLPIGVAGLLGLLIVLISLGLYPWVLQKLRWVPPRRARSSRARAGAAGAQPSDGLPPADPTQQVEGRVDGSR